MVFAFTGSRLSPEDIVPPAIQLVPPLKQDITPLHIAAQNGDLQTVQSLLAHGADVNARESEVLRLSSHTVENSLFRGPQSVSKYLFLGHVIYLSLS